MKKMLFVFATPLFLVACGSSKSGKQLAEEVCECSKKANALPTSDPSRTQAQNDCTTKQRDAWKK